jgi:hypothetical protein
MSPRIRNLRRLKARCMMYTVSLPQYQTKLRDQVRKRLNKGRLSAPLERSRAHPQATETHPDAAWIHRCSEHSHAVDGTLPAYPCRGVAWCGVLKTCLGQAGDGSAREGTNALEAQAQARSPGSRPSASQQGLYSRVLLYADVQLAEWTLRLAGGICVCVSAHSGKR